MDDKKSLNTLHFFTGPDARFGLRMEQRISEITKLLHSIRNVDPNVPVYMRTILATWGIRRVQPDFGTGV